MGSVDQKDFARRKGAIILSRFYSMEKEIDDG